MTQAGANSPKNRKPNNSSGVDEPKETLAQQPTKAFVLANHANPIEVPNYRIFENINQSLGKLEIAFLFYVHYIHA